MTGGCRPLVARCDGWLVVPPSAPCSQAFPFRTRCVEIAPRSLDIEQLSSVPLAESSGPRPNAACDPRFCFWRQVPTASSDDRLHALSSGVSLRYDVARWKGGLWWLSLVVYTRPSEFVARFRE